MNAFITGHKGFIGKELSCFLKRKGVNIFTYEGNILDDFILDKKIDIIVHLAGITPQSARLKKLNLLEYNIELVKKAIEIAQSNDAFLIFSSSSSVYGDQYSNKIKEDYQLSLKNAYSKSKAEGEEIILHQHIKGNIRACIFRIFNPYGARQCDSFIIPTIINSLVKAIPSRINNPSAIRDYIYIDDICEAIYEIMKVRDSFSNKYFPVYNLGSGKGISILDLIEFLSTSFKLKPELVLNKNLNNSISIADISKIQKQFNWQPKYDIRTGIEKMLLKTKLLLK